MNLYRQFLDLIPDPALQVGTVLSFTNGMFTIELPGGGTIKARGNGISPGVRVFVRGGVVEGPAPDLPIQLIEV